MHPLNLITKQEGTFVWLKTPHLSTTSTGRVGFFPEAECLGLFVEASRDASESMVSLVLVALCKLCKSGTDTPWQVRMMEWWWAGLMVFKDVSTWWIFPQTALSFEVFFRHKTDGKTMTFGRQWGLPIFGIGSPKHGIFKQHPNATGDAPKKKNYIIGWQSEPMEEWQHVINYWAEKKNEKYDTPFLFPVLNRQTNMFETVDWNVGNQWYPSQRRLNGMICQIVAGGFDHLDTPSKNHQVTKYKFHGIQVFT